MSRKGPGKSHRESIGIMDLFLLFPDEQSAVKWFEGVIWKGGRKCPKCGKSDTYAVKSNNNGMPYRCRDCMRYFSVKTGTVMASSKPSLQLWAIALCLEMSSLTGVSSMKLHRDLGISRNTTWHLLHKIQTGFPEADKEVFQFAVEVDEMYIGGKEKNKHRDKKQNSGRGAVGKTVVVGAKDRESDQVRAKVVESTTKPVLQDFVNDTRGEDVPVFTDEHRSYQGLSNHTVVCHSAEEWTVPTFISEMAHTNGIESFWSMLKRGYYGIYFKMSAWHLQRYVNEFAGRRNLRDLDTDKQMKEIARGMVGQRLTYQMLRMSNPMRISEGEKSTLYIQT